MSVKEVEAALSSLEELARKEQAPSHYLARHLLLSLGQALREGPEGALAVLLERARSAGVAAGPRWGEAVDAELGMACGEFAQSLDPRFLGLPNYDLEYTRSARARLEDRLRAARALGFQLSPRETDMLALSDQVFAAFCADREKAGGARGGSQDAPARGRRPGSRDPGR
jgi:hypothetical protein